MRRWWPVVMGAVLIMGGFGAAGLGASSPVRSSSPPPAPAPLSVHHVAVAGVDRTYLMGARPGGPKPVPLFVVVHGRAMTPVRMAAVAALDTGGPPALFVYPAGIGGSWNAGACCGPAQRLGVDDVGFLRAVIGDVVATVPGVDAKRVFLVGYSNGGRMAYRLACSAPGLVAGLAMVEAAPVVPCPLGNGHISLLVVASARDPLVRVTPDRPAQILNGFPVPALSDLAAQWRHIDGCRVPSTARSAGTLSSTTWSQCRAGSRVTVDVYSANGHMWPAGDARTPSAGQEIRRFFAGGPSTALAT